MSEEKKVKIVFKDNVSPILIAHGVWLIQNSPDEFVMKFFADTVPAPSEVEHEVIDNKLGKELSRKVEMKTINRVVAANIIISRETLKEIAKYMLDQASIVQV